MVIKEKHTSYGHCWLEKDGNYFYVYIMDGKSKYGPYSSFADAEAEYRRW